MRGKNLTSKKEEATAAKSSLEEQRKVSLMQTGNLQDGTVHTIGDASVTDTGKTEMEIWKHAERIWNKSTVPFQNLLEAVIFVSMAYALVDRQLFNRDWIKASLIVALGFTAVDMFAPAMSNTIRQNIPLLFFATSK
jgi:hypothetical protein